MTGWLRAHGRAMADALAAVRRAPVAALLSALALASAIALPLGAIALLASLERVAAGFDTDPQITLVLTDGSGPRERDALERSLRARPGVKAVRTVTRDQALADLQATEGVRDVLAGLPGNPLPDVMIVRVAQRGRAAGLAAEFARLPGVASVQADAAWVERLEALVAAGQVLAAAMAALLAVAVLLVTFNTIRLQIAARAEELMVASLVGATRAWQRRPFLYFGTLQGCVAGLAAAGLVAGTLWLARRELLRMQVGTDFDLRLDLLIGLGAVAAAAALGWLGARLAVRRAMVGARR